MKHFVYNLISGAAAPAGGGDTGSWFRFYKRQNDGETFVPVAADVSAEKGCRVRPGDRLWFVLDGEIVGGVSVLRVVSDELRGSSELWYAGGELVSHGVEWRRGTRGLANGQVVEIEPALGSEWGREPASSA